MLNQWITDDAVETLTRAANQLHRVAEAIEKEAEGIRKNGGDSIGDAMAFSMQEVVNALVNLRLDKFVRCTERAEKMDR